MKIFFLEMNARYKYAKLYLQNKGYEVCENIGECEILVLPFKNVNIEKEYNLNGEKKKLKKIIDENRINIKFIFTGVENKDLGFFLKEFKYYEFMRNKEIITLNSIATMEGTIKDIIENNIKTIFDSKFLVIGYGECGSTISNTLCKLGGFVEVIDRNDFKIARSKISGCKKSNGITSEKYDVIINTIPKEVINNSNLKAIYNVNNETYIIDISSNPYGFDLESCKKIGIKSKRLEKIPEKYAIKSSGKILGKYMNKIIRGIYNVER